MRHFSFPDIVQFRQVIRAVQDKACFVGLDENEAPIYDRIKPLPTIKYRGTVKLHGTNSAICKNVVTGEVTAQSRTRVLTIDSDNYGFAQFVSEVDMAALFAQVEGVEVDNSNLGEDDNDKRDVIVIYGEWCGKGIQKSVAIAELDKMFVVFAVRCRGVWLSDNDIKSIKLPDSKVYNILDYPHFTMDIDFQNPEIYQNKLGEITMEVERECPVAKALGVEGVGEGVVWVPAEPKWNQSKYWFKVKGQKHSVSKTKTLAPIDIERVNSINELIDNVVTENRLRQGVEVVKIEKGVDMLDRQHIGDFIRWIYNDIVKEESDTIEGSGLSTKEIGVHVSKRAKEWMFKELKV